jgi:hypothetical protein
MVRIHNVEQQSEEWFALKKGVLSASDATAIGANGAGLITLCKNKSLELIGIIKDPYTNEDFDRGNRLEPIGRAAYEFQTGLEIKEVGFITNDLFPNAGASPDGLIDKDPEGEGGCEIKARNDIKHFSLIQGETKEIPYNQIQMNLMISERKWWDFISINPNFLKNPLFVKRIYPDLAYFKKLEAGIKKGNELIEKMLKEYQKYGGTN